MKRSRIVVGVLAMAGGLFWAAGCAPAKRTIPAVPEELADAAQVPHISDVRGWGDGYSPAMERSLVGAWRQESPLFHF
ncbi:MAG: hypothetical protein NTV86_21680 [Planctomycetota bacterium]|nr:hypothetical protein [Planctomycetota bacterium]